VSGPPIEGARLTRALNRLAAADPALARALAEAGRPPPRHRPPGFPALLDIILAQQVSTASARAIAGRLDAALAGRIEPAGFLALDDAALAAIGFSRAKMRYGRGLAEAVLSRALDLEALARAPDEAAIEALVALKGLGRWSAEVYLLFALNRPDVMPADDLGLLLGLQRADRAEGRPTPRQLRERAEAWRPWRSVAARLLWHYYGWTRRSAAPAAPL
jgi:DNA-3-methyladenine glycosylase II